MKPSVNRIVTPVICSLAFLLFPIFSSPDFPRLTIILSNPNGQREVLTHILLLGFFYLSYHYLIPRFYFRQRYRLFYGLVTLCALLLFFLLFGVMGHHHVGPPRQKSIVGHPPSNILRSIFLDSSLYLFFIVFFLSLLLKNGQRWRKLQEEKTATELSYLKAQINPHFLFNTLNSIYALAIEKSDYTATAVVKLSGMMRYLISESNKHFVSLEKELSYISDYIELQQFRLGTTVKIRYTLAGDYRGKEIAPLILVTFVENAFKYGVNPEEHSEIRIRISVENDVLTLGVENNKVTTQQHSGAPAGLGIRNTRNRLELLYPGKHRLQISEDSITFRVHLEIQLA